MDDEIKYFDLNDDSKQQIAALIKDQGFAVCREILSTSFIRNAADNVEFGFYRMSPIAQIGQARRKSKQYMLHSFALCRVHKVFPDELLLDLICSRDRRSDGSKLLEHVENLARNLKMKAIVLDAIAEEALRKWYISKGFEVRTTTFLNGTECPKVYTMFKEL